MNIKQTMSDAGLNPFGAELLAESFLSLAAPESISIPFPVRKRGLEKFSGVWMTLHPIPAVENDQPRLMKDMNEPQLSQHLNEQLRFIKFSQTPDTIGSMLIVFQDNGITQYGATIDPETAPQALRELADRIEQRATVKR